MFFWILGVCCLFDCDCCGWLFIVFEDNVFVVGEFISVVVVKVVMNKELIFKNLFFIKNF